MPSTFNWTAITIEELEQLIQVSQQQMTLEEKEFWNQIRIAPTKWKEEEYGAEGNGFWVVGKHGNKIIWYNDIEEGFNISTFSQIGQIDEYGAEQDELQWTILKLSTQ